MSKKYNLIILLFLALSCNSPKKVIFKNYIDTKSRPIKLQTKKIYALENINVFASNKFDGARLSNFTKLNDSTAIANIQPENTPINNSPYYGFKIWSKEPKTFYVVLNYPKGFKHRYIPKIKKNGRWRVINQSNIIIKDSLTIIKLDLKKKKQTVAAQKIETSKDVQKWTTELYNKNKELITLKNVGLTTLGRKLPALIINKKNNAKKEVIILLTRQHPPEVTGYYAFQKFIETLFKEKKILDLFLKKHTIIAFPIINPDGVDLGHWRHNAAGVDTNRDWSKYNQPEIKQIVRFIEKYLKSTKSKIILGLDFHSTWYDIFYTNKDRKATTLPNFIDNWFKEIEHNIDNYKIVEASKNSTKPVSKGWFLNGHKATGITFEIGDETPTENLEKISSTAAIKMMQILNKRKLE